MPSIEDFQAELNSIFSLAIENRLTAVVVEAGKLHRRVGGYPGFDHRISTCCRVMRKNLMRGDEVLSEPPSGAGATLTIKYLIPRPK